MIARFNLGEYANFIAHLELPSGYSETSPIGMVYVCSAPEGPKTTPGTSIPQSSLSSMTDLPISFFETKVRMGRDRIYAFKVVRLNELSSPYMYIMVGIPKAEIIHRPICRCWPIYLPWGLRFW